MSEPDIDVDRELERLLGLTRHGTEPDVSAHARVQVALRQRIGSAAGAGSLRNSLRLKSWFFGIVGLATLLGVIAYERQPRPIIRQAPAPSADMVRKSGANEVASVASAADRTSPEREAEKATATSGTRTQPESSVRTRAPGLPSSLAGGDEVSLIGAMQRALRSGDTTAALSLAGEHARRFPSGALVEEREGGRGIARCRLASKSERAALLDAYLSRYAGSPYAPRVRYACTR